ncbi:MAG: iron-sulfur cluster carrier protein ApbC [Rhodospirillales bacterium]|nr:iron-sulfur cluster carrier protein ApbC [Rhodospirillales bacterium]
MADVTERNVLDALKRIVDPDRRSDIVTLGMVSAVIVKNGHVSFAIEVDPERGERLEPLRKAAEKAVYDLPGVLSTTVVLTAESRTPAPQPADGPPPQRGAAPHTHAHAHAHPHSHAHPPAQAASQARLLPGVESIVAVASGKGGVGKSTTAVNLALAMAQLGARVGILDADIYGPSLPRLLGLSGKPSSSDGKRIDPKEAYGVKCMSIGFMVEEETPIIWRGPMVMGALEQLMRDVNWGGLDILIVDMPPGTGDVQLTMAQRVPLAGAVIVSTPQDIALIDARKGLNMFRKVNVPVLGIVENMSHFICPHCGERSDIFSTGGARREAERMSVPFLGEIPLAMAIRETSDSGRPIVAAEPDGPHAKAYLKIAENVRAQLALGKDDAPRIVVE